MTIQGGNLIARKLPTIAQNVYAPISVIYGELWDLFMKVFRNVGLFIQVPVGFFVAMGEKFRTRREHGLNFIAGREHAVGSTAQKREPVSRLPFLLKFGWC
jgi:hypothetical protein